MTFKVTDFDYPRMIDLSCDVDLETIPAKGYRKLLRHLAEK